MPDIPKTLPAILWDKQVRLEGQMLLEEDRLTFQYEKPNKSGLNLVILRDQIRSIEEYLLFGLERKGICIKSGEDREDQFIVDDPRKVRKVLLDWLKM